MKLRFSFIVAIGFAIISCSSKEHHSQAEGEISGTYVREYSFMVTNPETGIEIGMRTVRDTIFVSPKENGYEVSNNKWRLNDYDREGWKNMEHSDDRPMPIYESAFDPLDSSLINESTIPLYLDIKDGLLCKGKKRDSPYRRSK